MSRLRRRLLRVYVDETGDRGCGASASPYFAFAAVMVADEDELTLRQTIARLRIDLNVPAGKYLHWKEHVKVFPRRQHVATMLAPVPVQVVYVLVSKADIPTASVLRSDHIAFYNFAARLLMERVLRAANHCAGGQRDVVVRFGHVRGFDHASTKSYFSALASNPGDTPWHLLWRPPSFDQQAQWDGLQAADQYAGMLNVAVRQDPYGGYEEAHLLRIRHQIRRDPSGSVWGSGLKILGKETLLTTLPWWPDEAF